MNKIMSFAQSDPSGSLRGHPASRLMRYGPWAVVTGASDGIGRALAGELARAGLNVLLVARRRDRLEALARDVSSATAVEARVAVLDLSSRGGVTELIRLIASLDVGLLAHCAGFGSSGPFIEQSIESELEMLSLNCSSTLELAHTLALRGAKRRSTDRRSALILFSSVVGFQGVPGSAHYAATKAYVQSLGEGLDQELHSHGIDVLTVAPGPVATGFGARAGLRMGNAADPGVIARAIVARLERRWLSHGTVRPGGLAKLLGWSLALLPRGSRVRLMGIIMRGMMTPRLDVESSSHRSE